jgi:predicted nucleic acid-binding protein
VIVDTSVLLAYFDSNEPAHRACADVIESAASELVVSPFVVAEVDYLLATLVSADAERVALEELSSGAWRLADFPAASMRAAIQVLSRYEDQQIGLADASLVVLADLFHTRTIATLDRRHFDVLRPLNGGRFTVVP